MLRLTKHHGLGNDFLVALADDNPGLEPAPDVARRLCDRRLGVGADGLLYGLPVAAGDDATVRMVLLNSDGSRAELSGNGLRCLAQAVLRRSGRGEGAVVVTTDAGHRALRTVRGDVDGELWVRVDMGRPGPPPAWPDGRRPQVVDDVPGLRAAVTVDVGNPHVVLVVDDLDRVDVTRVGPALERSVPGGINVHAAAVSGHGLRLAVWERGAGATRACGSGATAAAYAARGLGLVGDRVEVAMPGGTATVEVDGDHLLLTGPTCYVAEVVAP